MKALMIGGTGTISASAVKRLLDIGWEVTLLNRGIHGGAPEGTRVWTADVNDEERVQQLLKDETFDTIADFIVFTPEQAARRELRILCDMVPDERDPRHAEASAKLIDVENRQKKGGAR